MNQKNLMIGGENHETDLADKIFRSMLHRDINPNISIAALKVSRSEAAELARRIEKSGAKACFIVLDRKMPGCDHLLEKITGKRNSFEEMRAMEARLDLALEELDQVNQKFDETIKKLNPSQPREEKVGGNIVFVDEAHFKPAREFDSIVLRQNPSKVMHVSENGEYSDYAIPKIISNLSTIQQNKQNIIRMNQNRNNNSSASFMSERQLKDTASSRSDTEKKQGIHVLIQDGNSRTDGQFACKLTLSNTDESSAISRIFGHTISTTHQSRDIKQLLLNQNKEREKTRNALYSRVKQTSASNHLLDSQPDSSPILVQQTPTGQGKTELVTQFWKKASFDATVSELIQQSSRLVIGANEFIYDRATFVNQSKVRAALGLIKDIDEFITKLTGILNSSPIDGQPLPNISEFPQYAAMAEIRRDLVDAFCSRVAPMYGKPRERANRLISEMPLNYQIELTERINSQL